MKNTDRYNLGFEKLSEVGGKQATNALADVEAISPDLAQFVTEYAYGYVYSRKILDLKSKEIAIVAALTARANAQPQLTLHLNCALNVGVSINELKEIILQMSIISGFPSAVNGMNALREVLAARKEQGVEDCQGAEPSEMNAALSRQEIGEHELTQLDALQVERLKAAYNDFSPELVKFTIEYGYADVFSRDNIDKKYRQIANIASLTAIGNTQQLKFHIHAALNIGITVDEVKEIILLLSVFAGFPSAVNGITVLKDLLNSK